MVVVRSSRKRIVHSNGAFKYAATRFVSGPEVSRHDITVQVRNSEMKQPMLFLPRRHKQQQQLQQQQHSCNNVTHTIIVTLVLGFFLWLTYFTAVAHFWNRTPSEISASNNFESQTSMRYASNHVFEIKGEKRFSKPECSARRTPPFTPFGCEICSNIRCSSRRTSRSFSGHIKLWHHTRPDRQSYNGEHMIEYEPMCILPPRRGIHNLKVDTAIPGVDYDQSGHTEDSQQVVFIPSSPKWTCSDHANNFSIPHKKCVRFVTKADHGKFSLGDMRSSEFAPRSARWVDSPVYLFWLHARDSNVCHALMRFLFLWNHLRDREGYTPIYEANQDVESPSIVIVANSTALFRLYSPLSQQFPNDSVENILPFHAGLLYYLFQRCGINVIVVPSVSDLLKHDDENGLCIRRAIVAGSHSNRFAFPDVERPPVTQNSDTPLLSYPLSTNALAISDFVFGNQPLASRRQSYVKALRLVYVAREVGKRRSFDERSENRLRSMLHHICERHSCTVDIFEASFSTPFYRQALTFRKADIVVGAHGAGLSLAVFSPVHCAIVEIAMANYWVPLFENLVSGGRTYRLVRLQNNSHINGTNLNVVSKTDLMKIRRSVEGSIENIYQTVRRIN